MLIAPVISFIADYLSLGDLPSIVAAKVKSMREWILGLIEKALTWLIEKGKALLAALGIGKKEEKKEKGEDELGKVVTFAAAGEVHELWVDAKGATPEVVIASDQRLARVVIEEYTKKAMKLKDEAKKKEADALLRHAWQMLGEIHTRATAYMNAKARAAEPASDEAGVADQAVESAEDKLAADLQRIREILGERKPLGEVYELARAKILALPREPDDVAALSDGLKTVVSDLNKDGLQKIEARGPAHEVNIFATAVDDDDKEKEALITFASKQHSDRDRANVAFLILLIDGHRVIDDAATKVFTNIAGTGHAEYVFGNQILGILQRYKRKYARDPQRLYFLINYSPCYHRCAPYLIGLRNGLRARYPELEFEIDFLLRYKSGEKHTLLDAESGIAELEEAGFYVRNLAEDENTKKTIKV
jgi:hypothetical protein